jgi:hypothetical protein
MGKSYKSENGKVYKVRDKARRGKRAQKQFFSSKGEKYND